MLLMLLLACDDDIFPPPTGGGDVVQGDSYADVVTVFEGACVSCHGAGAPTAGLDLETDPCAAIVDVSSVTYGAAYVAPGDSPGSVVWNKMADTGVHGGVMPTFGAVAEASVATVAAWIDAGASCDDTADTALTDQTGAEP
ncbi:MAG: c-type cytochrome domain-containing protein [Pseudomonadota bacterium]|nr:c-type cytochrome domain-containing protein [Pseudomonadota bacterium]